MKKYIYSLMFLLMTAVTVGLASCGDDDEPKSADIVGTWAYNNSDIDGDFTILFQFTKDGKFHEVQTQTVNGEIITDYVYHGTYTVSGDKLLVTYIFQNETETGVCIYSVNGDKLTIYLDDEDPAIFTRVKNSVIEPYL